MEEAVVETVNGVELDTSEGNVVSPTPNDVAIVEVADAVHSVPTGESSEVHRAKHKCPLKSCGADVVHLPRHMRQVHRWSNNKARGVLGAFDIRKPRKLKKKEKRRVFKRRVCPVKGCLSVVRRIHNHLTDVHKLKRNSKIYWRCVDASVLFDPQVMSNGCTGCSKCMGDESDDQSGNCREAFKPPKKKRKKSSDSKRVDDQSVKNPREALEAEKKKRKKSSDSKRVHDQYVKTPREALEPEKRKRKKSSDNKRVDDQYAKTPREALEPEKKKRKKSSDSESSEDGFIKKLGEAFGIERKRKKSNTVYEAVYGNGPPETSSDDKNTKDVNQDTDYSPSQDEDPASSTDGELNDSELECDGTDSAISNSSSELLKHFELWMKGPDGGRKDDKCATQTMRQVERILLFIDPESSSIHNILSKSILRDQWLTKIENEKQPGTVKSYLGALCSFYIFLQEERTDDLSILKTSVPELMALSDQAKLWSRSYRKLTKDRFWEKRMEDFENIKSPEDVKKFDTSEVARSAVKYIGEYQDATEDEIISQLEYTTVRDYLMTEICINNGSRSGSIANMTLDEFNNAKQKEDCYVVLVKNHKTFTTHGPVNVVFTDLLYKYMLVYITKLRNQLPAVDTTPKATIFLSFRGTAMDSSQVGAQIGSCWAKVFGKQASTGGATSIRKAVVSAVHESNETMRGDLANLMVHNRATADRYYLLQDKGKSAVRTSKEVTRIMRGVSKDQPKSEENAHSNDETNLIQPSSRHSWKDEEVSAIKTLFSKNIEEQSISMKEVKTQAQNHAVIGQISFQKIIDKVRSLFKDGVNLDRPVPPQEWESTVEKLKRTGFQTCSDSFPSTAGNKDYIKNEESGEKTSSDVPVTSCGEDDIQNKENSEKTSSVIPPMVEKLKRIGFQTWSDSFPSTAGTKDYIKNEESGEKTSSDVPVTSCGEDDIQNKENSEKASSVIPPSSRGRGGATLLNSKESAEFRELFKNIIQSKKTINTKQIRLKLAESATLSHISNGLSDRQLGDKIRTERRIDNKCKGNRRR